jgi:hypothetical protein
MTAGYITYVWFVCVKKREKEFDRNQTSNIRKNNIFMWEVICVWVVLLLVFIDWKNVFFIIGEET